jgi:hypothetical protein
VLVAFGSTCGEPADLDVGSPEPKTKALNAPELPLLGIGMLPGVNPSVSRELLFADFEGCDAPTWARWSARLLSPQVQLSLMCSPSRLDSSQLSRALTDVPSLLPTHRTRSRRLLMRR